MDTAHLAHLGLFAAGSVFGVAMGLVLALLYVLRADPTPRAPRAPHGGRVQGIDPRD